ncbi:hypothetical protein M9H77_13580 [Catharanthus roseus]|uniref:Uncharacterized protein n=1 Tax=Catharanthus roseus TaxID=4058 RepID=A0ACC0BKL5_CATRO|nr:hypothetical protein M9H77_13580 [Catharanthus roseus]
MNTHYKDIMSLNEDSPNNKIQTNLNVLAKILSTKKLTINVVRTILYPTGKLGEKLSMSHKEDPLSTGFFLDRGSLGFKWIQFRYERLGDFCFECGKIGHKESICTYPPIKKCKLVDPRQAYGPWLRPISIPLSQADTPAITPLRKSSLSSAEEPKSVSNAPLSPHGNNLPMPETLLQILHRFSVAPEKKNLAPKVPTPPHAH